MFNKNDNFAQQDQTLSIPDLTRKLNKSEPTEIQIQAVVQLRGQVLKTNLQSILDSSMNLKLDTDADDELSLQLVDEKVKLYLKMLKLTAIPFQIEQINILFTESLLCKELTMTITLTSLQFISEFIDKTQSISKGGLGLGVPGSKQRRGPRVLPDAFGQPYRAWRPSTSRGSPPLQRSIPQRGPRSFPPCSETKYRGGKSNKKGM
ncbi:Hypothetical_protein [Hexamita inflata]|uniref:Hypothetical_protein n=1 Tax=Hexamita inflata TaxID=28002 RepID=A0AA86TXD3_9EUKA|nr:Hypothetical protein HINF_LOCUS19576 [Hexamita inflata]